MAMDWEDRGRYGGGYENERGRGSWRGGRDRDWSDRAGDEVRSWFGDDDAERCRMEDDRRYASRGYGRGSRGGYGDDDYAYGGYGGYGDRGPGVSGAYAGYDRPWGYGGYGGSYGSDVYGRRGYGMGDRDR